MQVQQPRRPMNTNLVYNTGSRITSQSGGSSPSAPLGNISNRVLSNSADEVMNRQDTSRKPSRVPMVASDGTMGHETEEIRPRIGSRSSIGGRRSLSGAKGGPSALRRLPPGVTPRSVVPSISVGDETTRERLASGSTNNSARPTVAALARVNQSGSGPRRSLGASINAAASGGMAQHDREVREVVKLNVNSTNFEEWMKMATDNKINATNTWNFALIDYFHDMSLLRSDNGDGSINFQKASCTLDGCVKVWTSRVDSVVVETGKLLSGLQDDGKDLGNKTGRGRGGDDEDEEGADDANEGAESRTKKRRTKEPTMAKSFAQLAAKKLDLEFTVDPLFKKTSADFDEGGAGGLLMNHLGVDSNVRVVFDAGDVAGVAEEEDNEPKATLDAMEEDSEQDTTAHAADQVDLSRLRNKLFSHFEGHSLGEESAALSSMLSDLVICPTFSSFKFAPGDDTPFSAFVNDDTESTPMPQSSEFLPALQEFDQDDFNDAPAYEDYGADDAFGSADPFTSAPLGLGTVSYDEDGMDMGMGMPGRQMMIPADAPIDFSSAFQGITDEQGLSLNGDGFFDYFDQRLTKNWAGPEHWKMRNLGLGAAPAHRGDALAGDAAERTARKSKEPFVVDFCSEEGAVSTKEIFEPAKGGAGITLPQQRGSAAMDLHLLPEDRHFNSRQLLRLFIKPRAMLNLKRRGVAVEQIPEAGQHPSDVDDAFWAQAAAVREASRGLGTESEYADAETGGMDYDDGGFDGMDEPGGLDLLDVNAEDEELATQALKRIRPEFVNYAKKAKRVDVRKLKENIWKQLAIDVDSDSDSNSSEDEGDKDEEDNADKSATPRASTAVRSARKSEALEPRVFQSALSGLRKAYPKDRLDEISTSFCFICLLHLANEEGLQITTSDAPKTGTLESITRMGGIVEADEQDDALGEDDDDAENDDGARGESRVGFLEQLSIIKDPNAGRSA